MPTEAIHVLGYLDMRVDEGPPRSALKCFKASLVFFEQVTGVEEKDKVSIKPLVVNGYKEVLLRAAQGRLLPPSTPLLKLLWSMERSELGVLRFDDHHGFHPHQLVLDGRGLTAAAGLRPLFISRSSWVGGRYWMDAGLELMNKFMNFELDYLLPSPSSDGFGHRPKPLVHDDASILSKSIFRRLRDPSLPVSLLLQPRVAEACWTERGARSFIPTAQGPLQTRA